ncbi:MAG: type I DNA topoisomerase [Bacteroidales bacterium]|nr:type I DNA topoisomerase [Bacteroidales bacterium]
MANKGNIYDLVIVESPAKAKTIEQFLGDGYIVKSSYGHIRDLKKNNFGVDVEHGYEPEYIIPDDKQQVVTDLKKLSKGAGSVWLASDEDREGEAISWHLAEVLGLDAQTTKRIVFHEITKDAILNAIKTPRTIDMNLVNAQQARRVLDRLVGFELSPVLWRKVKPQLSAGRVQSVAVRIIVEREREIFAFESQPAFQTIGTFVLNKDGQKYELKAELGKKIKDKDVVKELLGQLQKSRFTVDMVEKKPLTRTPAPPFTTSTLQQEASRKLGYSVSQTMSIAQHLYEAGLITYMRTDSVNLAEAAIKSAAGAIVGMMGKEYLQTRRYKTNSKGAQEAHEAIRPTHIENHTIDGTSQEKRLYELIWKRTIASQMAEAKLEKTTIHIKTDNTDAQFTASAEVIKFDGFIKVYTESTDDDSNDDSSSLLPSVAVGDVLGMKEIVSREKWSQKPPRYNEASLVHKLEELGIGRPSTYAPTISTIQQRGYVVKESREGQPRNYKQLKLTNKGIDESEKTEMAGAEKSKLFPTDIGMIVNDFLLQNFDEVMDYNFTAEVEKQFDEIADGSLKWQKVMDDFYKPFHVRVEDTMEHSAKNTGERILGIDPKSGKQVSVRVGRFGPMAQIGDADEDNDQRRYSSLKHGQHVETITLEEALQLFELPRHIGEYEGKEVVIGTGRFGPYVRHDGKFVSLKKTDDPYTIDLDAAIVRIEEKRVADSQKLIKEFDEDVNVKILNGRWGPYIAWGKVNVKIPKGTEADKLTFDDCKALYEKQESDGGVKSRAAKAASSAEAATDDQPKTKKASSKVKKATAKK